MIISPAHGGSTTAYEFGDNVYLIVNEPASWTQAHANAEAALGHLAIVTSEAENQFLYTNLLARGISTTADDGGGARYAWLGGSDATLEGTWRWVDTNLLSSGYTKWGSGFWGSEPDDYNGAQDHLALGLEGWPTGAPGGFGNASEWNDVNGSNSLAYVIEYESPDLDTDEDGMPDWQEFIAATDPTNPTSVLQGNISLAAQNRVVVSWDGAEVCSYSVDTATNLVQSNWITITNAQGVNALMTYTNNIPDIQRFYLIHAER